VVHWYLIHTKPRQEQLALDNLERQGYECYLPYLPDEKLLNGLLTIVDKPLFPRYLFIRLGHDHTSKSWAPIRSTLGVSTLVRFGTEPAKIADELIGILRRNERQLQLSPEKLFKLGERVTLTESPFAGIEGIYQMAEGERRVMVLIEILSKSVTVRVGPASLRKVV
jgi:transcriptional antiterminator RfaH